MQWLSRPVASSSLVAFRVAFGLVMAWWAIDYLRRDQVRLLCGPDVFHFTYYGFDWVRPWPGNGMVLQFAGMFLAALMIALGASYRVATIFFAITFTHYFLIDRTNYQNHYYLVTLLSWVMVVIPANRLFSVDVLNGRVRRSLTVPHWCLLLLQFHIAIPYFYGGLAKLESDWLSTDPMRYMLMAQSWFPLLESKLDVRLAAGVLTWGGLLFDLLVVPALLWPRTRALAYGAAVLFHLTNSILFSIHIFPWMMIAATPILFSPDWPRRVLGLPLLRLATTASPAIRLTRRQRAGFGLLGIYILFHLVWPFRHLLNDGNTGWTEDGHYFAWRMMLRGKSTGIRYYVTDPKTGETWNADIRRYLNHVQQGKFARDPEMIQHFAHFLANEYARELGYRVQIRALVLTSMNGRKPQLLVDPAVDLAATPRGLHRKDWITPLTEPLRPEPWIVPLNEWERHVEIPDLLLFKLSRTIRDLSQGSTNADSASDRS